MSRTNIPGFIKFFDFDGEEILADREALLKVERQTRSVKLIRKLVKDRPGRYWLVSNRPCATAMLLGANLYRPVTWNGGWAIVYDTQGIAGHVGFDINEVITLFSESAGEAALSFGHDAALPRNVASLARGHVRFKKYAPLVKKQRPVVKAFLE